jgi:hypothetical protein
LLAPTRSGVVYCSESRHRRHQQCHDEQQGEEAIRLRRFSPYRRRIVVAPPTRRNPHASPASRKLQPRFVICNRCLHPLLQPFSRVNLTRPCASGDAGTQVSQDDRRGGGDGSDCRTLSSTVYGNLTKDGIETMMRWEYRKIALNDRPRRTHDIDSLCDAGRDGWELIAIVANNVAYLKRERPEEDAEDTVDANGIDEVIEPAG